MSVEGTYVTDKIVNEIVVYGVLRMPDAVRDSTSYKELGFIYNEGQ